MKHNNLPTANFVHLPFQIEDLQQSRPFATSKPYCIEKTIVLGKIDYENFATDLCVEREFTIKNTALCRIDKDGVWHCLLVRRRFRHAGILVMTNGESYPEWAAYINGF